MRPGRVAVGAACAALSLVVGSCALRVMGGTMVLWGEAVREAGRPDARDVELARQMGAPEDVVGRLERGEWPRSGAKGMIDLAIEAIAYMREEHGVECEAVSADLPGMFSHTGRAKLRVASGEHEGEEVRVEADMSRLPHVLSDSWYWNLHHEEFERACRDAAAEALASLPEGSWVCEASMTKDTYSRFLSPDTPLSESYVNGNLYVYALRMDELNDEEFAALTESVMTYVSAIGPTVHIEFDELAMVFDGQSLTLATVHNVLEKYDEPCIRDWRGTANPYVREEES